MRVLRRINKKAQVALETIIALTIMVMFVAFMAQFIRWEIQDMNQRIRAYKNIRCKKIYGSQLGSISVKVYSGSSFYDFYKKNSGETQNNEP